jgi:hypothetical protein
MLETTGREDIEQAQPETAATFREATSVSGVAQRVRF